MRTLDDRLLPVFVAQHGLVRLADVKEAGGDYAAASRRVRSGRWSQADVATYHLTGLPVTWHTRLLAPILAIGEGAVASHFAAAALHRIDGYGRGVPELTVPRGFEHRRPGLRLHTSTDLDRCDPVVIEGIPTTGLTRTVLDIGRKVGDQSVLSAIEWSRRNHRADWPDFIRTLVLHARRGRPGIRRLRRVILGNMDRAEVTDSEFELLVLALIAEFGLPTPKLHHQVFDGERFVAEVDLAYPANKVAIELDGKHHLNEAVWQRDLPRQNDLVLAGWVVLRFTWERFSRRPDQLIKEIRAALDTTAANAS